MRSRRQHELVVRYEPEGGRAASWRFTTPIRMRVEWVLGRYYTIEVIADNHLTAVRVGKWELPGARVFDPRRPLQRLQDHELAKGRAIKAMRRIRRFVSTRRNEVVIS